MTPFEKALLQAVNDDFSHVPPEEELDFSPISIKKPTRKSVLRRCLLVAAVCILLVGSVVSAYVIKYRLGPVEVADITEMINLKMEGDNDNTYYSIEFADDFISPTGPDTIETFYLPTIMVEAETLERHNHTYISNRDMGGYYPFGVLPDFLDTKPEDFPRILEVPDSVSYGWKPSDDLFIGFDQYVAKNLTNGTLNGFHMVFENSEFIVPSHETIEIDEYSIFTFNVDSTKKPIWDDKYGDIWRNWFWTDGEYLFKLSSTGLTMEEMTDLFRSIKAVSTEYPYCKDEAHPDSILENFNLMETPEN